MKKIFRRIAEIIKKIHLKYKLMDMDFTAELTGMSSWMLFPPSFYYTHTEEEIAQATAEAKVRIFKMLDKLECNEPEQHQMEKCQ